MGTELQFDSPEGDDFQDQEEQSVEEQAQEELSEEEPEQQADPIDSRLSSVETTLADIAEYLRSQAKPSSEEAPAAASKNRPNFGDNTAAQVIYDKLEALESRINEPWQKIEKERKQTEALQAAEAALLDDTVRYVSSRASQGDPKVDSRQVVGMLISMGQLANPRIPITEALKNAYNAVAWDAMKESQRNRGINDARKPDAKIPVFNRPAGNQPSRSPQARPQSAGKPGESKLDRAKREADAANARLARFSEDELQDAFGGN